MRGGAPGPPGLLGGGRSRSQVRIGAAFIHLGGRFEGVDRARVEGAEKGSGGGRRSTSALETALPALVVSALIVGATALTLVLVQPAQPASGVLVLVSTSAKLGNNTGGAAELNVPFTVPGGSLQLSQLLFEVELDGICETGGPYAHSLVNLAQGHYGWVQFSFNYSVPGIFPGGAAILQVSCASVNPSPANLTVLIATDGFVETGEQSLPENSATFLANTVPRAGT